jgi:hypothetical protein
MMQPSAPQCCPSAPGQIAGKIFLGHALTN